MFFFSPKALIFSMQNEQCFLDWFSIPFIHSSVPFLFIRSSSFVAHQIDGMPAAVFSEHGGFVGFVGFSVVSALWCLMLVYFFMTSLLHQGGKLELSTRG